MDVLVSLRNKAKALNRSVVFPEGEDDRTIKAVSELEAAGTVRSIILGDPEKIQARAKELGLNLGKVEIINPPTSPRLKEYATLLYERRKHKGMTLEQARTQAQDPSSSAHSW